MPAQKKKWVFDGTIEQFPDDFLDTTHGGADCIPCHGGDDSASTREAAHGDGWVARPSAENCTPCHTTVKETAAMGLHTTMGGYLKVLGDRGVDFEDETTWERFESKCLDCHIANEEQTESRCGHCHVSTPYVAGGGFINGHNFRETPDMERQCTACHGSRIKDEFMGLNGALVDRNDLDVTPPTADVHLAKTREINDDGYEYGCTFCHSGDELHGSGAPVTAEGDRYNVSTAPHCVDCHEDVATSDAGIHSSAHVNAMTCYVCHAQAYKNCFNCHLDVDGDTGKAFFVVNEGDPTLALRPPESAPDALMTFRIGMSQRPDKLNPLTDEPYGYTVVRHPPIDRDLFRYSGANEVNGLIPDMTALPTWKFATPHNVSRAGYGVAAACFNCHPSLGGTGDDWLKYWLFDAIQNHEGWGLPDYDPDEAAANEKVIVDRDDP